MRQGIIIFRGLSILLICVLTTPDGATQGDALYARGIWGVSYNISVPVGDAKDFVGKNSFRGMTVESRRLISPNLSVGGSVGWHVFHQKLEDFTAPLDFTFELDDVERNATGAITGDQFRYLNAMPIMANVHYYMGDPRLPGLSFYGGIGVGTTVVQRRLELGVFAIDNTTWHFTVSPEVGVMKSLKSFYRIIAGTRYVQTVSSSDVQNSYLNFQIGIVADL